MKATLFTAEAYFHAYKHRQTLGFLRRYRRLHARGAGGAAKIAAPVTEPPQHQKPSQIQNAMRHISRAAVATFMRRARDRGG